MTRRTALVLAHLVFLFGSGIGGCAIVPSAEVKHIYASENRLLVVTYEGFEQIKLFDTGSDALIARIGLSKVSGEGELGVPMVRAVYEDSGHVVLEVHAICANENNLHILVLRDRRIETRGVLPCSFHLIAADANYYYFTEAKEVRSDGAVRRVFEPRRMDKALKEVSEFHFEGKTLIVVDTWEDGDLSWYVCVDHDSKIALSPMTGRPLFSGRIVVVAEHKPSGHLEEFDSGEIVSPYTGTSDEGDAIWIFGGDARQTKVLEFSKTAKTFDLRTFPVPVAPIKHLKPAKGSDYLWVYRTAYQHPDVHRIDKRDWSDIRLETPALIRSSTFFPTFSDDEYVWIGATKIRRVPPLMPNIPYLIKVRKSDLAVETVLVRPTVAEAVGAFGKSGVAWGIGLFMGITGGHF